MENESTYWDMIYKKEAKEEYPDELVEERYRLNHLNLLLKWANVKGSQLVLKTDLFGEATGSQRAFLWDMLQSNNNVVSTDISFAVVSGARERALQHAPGLGHYVNCDLRELPFASNSFDLIVSDSSLDHFKHEVEILTALFELTRVLKRGGTLIITMDNKGNLTEPLFRLWIYFGLAPFFSGKTYSIKELIQALTRVKLCVMDVTAIVHYPRFFTKMTIRLLRKIMPSRLDRNIRRVLAFFDRLESTQTKYLTGLFIAAKAVKLCVHRENRCPR